MKKKKAKHEEVVDVWKKSNEIDSDVLGSYTGMGMENNHEKSKPVQDVDDL
jgi:hypothetical protein